MDHVLEGMKSHYNVLLELFVEAHRSGKYKRYSDNPFYYEVKTLIDAMNIIRKYMGWENLTLKTEVQFYL